MAGYYAASLGTVGGAVAAGATVGAATSAASTAIQGGTLRDIGRSALVGAATGAVTAGLSAKLGAYGANPGSAFGSEFGKHLLHSAAHGVVGGGVSAAQGGTFKSGFLSSAAASFLAPGINKLGLGTAGDGILHLKAARTAVAGVIGGTVSVIGGGKFVNGAITAAFQHAFNHEAAQFGKRSFILGDVFVLNDKGQVLSLNIGNMETRLNNVYVAHPNVNYSGQCATGAQYLTGQFVNGNWHDAPSTTSWEQGASLTASEPRIGTMIARGWEGGRYPSRTPESYGENAGDMVNHVGLYAGRTSNGQIRLLSQNPSGFRIDNYTPNMRGINDWSVVTSNSNYDSSPSSALFSATRGLPASTVGQAVRGRLNRD